MPDETTTINPEIEDKLDITGDDYDDGQDDPNQTDYDDDQTDNVDDDQQDDENGENGEEQESIVEDDSVVKSEKEIPETPTQVTPELNDEAISQSLYDKLAEKLGLTKNNEEVKEQHPWEKENRNPTILELKAMIKGELKKELADEELARQTKINEETQAKQAESDRVNRQITNEFKILESKNEIPQIKDASNLNDPGVKARRDILNKLIAHNTSQKDPESQYGSIASFYYTQYKDSQKPSGYDAPVGGSAPGIQPQRDTFTYEELRNSTYEDILGN